MNSEVSTSKTQKKGQEVQEGALSPCRRVHVVVRRPEAHQTTVSVSRKEKRKTQVASVRLPPCAKTRPKLISLGRTDPLCEKEHE